MITISPVHSAPDCLRIEKLADAIWRKHYIPMVGKPQIDYMLHKYQSETAIANQIKEGFEYFLLHADKVPVGYIAIKKEVNELFLSKIYVLSNYRRQGIGTFALRFVKEKAKKYQLKAIRLTVNVNNSNSIAAYKRLGFENTGTLITDIGQGFVMDDYVMVKPL
ncbi:GNAT family N-acetyltransferase [Mariniflexile ostreae]|uniref:GNAT family N-acetyltransferase n=1 Tax=Mariniflexile ostreae TaxID=1520892 RepID=A0ABV5FCI3_9FLAO